MQLDNKISFANHSVFIEERRDAEQVSKQIN